MEPRPNEQRSDRPSPLPPVTDADLERERAAKIASVAGHLAAERARRGISSWSVRPSARPS